MDKEKLLDAKIQEIKRRAREQEEREKRLQEEEDQLLAEMGFGRRELPQEPEYDNEKYKSRSAEPLEVRSAHMDDPEFTVPPKPVNEALKWHDERVRVDREREARSKNSDGTWAREWDDGKGNFFAGHKKSEQTSGWNRSDHSAQYHGRGGGRRSHPETSGGSGSGQNQRRSGTGWSPTENTNYDNGKPRNSRNLRRNSEENGDGMSQNTKDTNKNVSAPSRNFRGTGRGVNRGRYGNDQPRNRRGEGRGLAVSAHRQTDKPGGVLTVETAIKQNETTKAVSGKNQTSSVEEQTNPRVESSSEIVVEKEESSGSYSLAEDQSLSENQSVSQDDENGKLPSSSTMVGQESEEEQFEDVNEDWSSTKNDDGPNENGSAIEPEAPSSAFASMSASSVDLQPAMEWSEPSANFVVESEEAIDEHMALANKVVSTAIEGALSYLSQLKLEEEIGEEEETLTENPCANSPPSDPASVTVNLRE